MTATAVVPEVYAAGVEAALARVVSAGLVEDLGDAAVLVLSASHPDFAAVARAFAAVDAGADDDGRVARLCVTAPAGVYVAVPRSALPEILGAVAADAEADAAAVAAMVASALRVLDAVPRDAVPVVLLGADILVAHHVVGPADGPWVAARAAADLQARAGDAVALMALHGGQVAAAWRAALAAGQAPERTGVLVLLPPRDGPLPAGTRAAGRALAGDGDGLIVTDAAVTCALDRESMVAFLAQGPPTLAPLLGALRAMPGYHVPVVFCGDGTTLVMLGPGGEPCFEPWQSPGGRA